MIKTLLKKQLMEINVRMIRNGKTGRKNSVLTIVMMTVLYVVVFGLAGIFFWGIGSVLCGPLVQAGVGWLYLTLMFLLAVLFGVFGNVFTTYSSLYLAKDNEFLLSMPIKPGIILAVRIIGVWIWGILYESIVLLPTLLVYWIQAACSPERLLGGIGLILFGSLIVLSLSCIIGYIVAGISVRLKHKNLVIVLVSLAGMAVYYYVTVQASQLLQKFLQQAVFFGEKIRNTIPILSWPGRAGEGDLLSLLLIGAISLILFAAVYLLMSRSFLKISTTASPGFQSSHRKRTLKTGNQAAALLMKERRRFTSSAVYMLNTSLSSVFLTIGGIYLLAQKKQVMEILEELEALKSLFPMAACFALCGLGAMNDITAPSISIEGKNLWILQSLPVKPWDVLKAKLKLHLLVTWIPLLFCTVCFLMILQPGIGDGILILLLPALYVIFSAELGLAVNLKLPKLDWTNEIVPIKQGMSVLVTLIAGIPTLIGAGFAYYFLSTWISPGLFLMIFTFVMVAADAGLMLWLKTRGSRIFSRL